MSVFTQTPLRAALALALGAALMPAAHATNGYFPHGFGIKAKGMGGASIATADDAFTGVNNPGAGVFAGNQMEAGVDLFRPFRDMSRTGFPMAGMLNTAQESGKTAFLIPEFGYNTVLSNKMAVGLSVYGNGGMNSSYPGGETVCGNPQTGQPMAGMNPMCGMGKLGVDLMQLIIAPNVSYKLNDNHSVGVSPLIVYQRFEAYGLQGFAMNSANPTALTNTGTDTSMGLGVKLGYMGKLSDKVSVGATYSPQISMGKFKKYAGLFADQGMFDIPENYGVGLAFQATPTVKIALDYNRINYSKVAAIGNSSTNGMLGGTPGGGFGWSDVDVVKLGVSWKMNPKTTLRFGYNHGTNPVTSGNITPNILAPGVMTSHWTMGGTYELSPKSELSWALMVAPKVTVTGPSMFNGMMGTGTMIQESVSMRQYSIGVQYGWKF